MSAFLWARSNTAKDYELKSLKPQISNSSLGFSPLFVTTMENTEKWDQGSEVTAVTKPDPVVFKPFRISLLKNLETSEECCKQS